MSTPNGSTFYGNGRDDDVSDQHGGLFVGGLGKDHVDNLYGGFFNGARGSDAVDRNKANLGWYMVTATFHGGPGYDYAEICGDGNTLTNVEPLLEQG